MPFDIQGAKAAGYSDKEINNYLAGSLNFDIEGARNAGYSSTEITEHLLQMQEPPPVQEELPQEELPAEPVAESEEITSPTPEPSSVTYAAPELQQQQQGILDRVRQYQQQFDAGLGELRKPEEPKVEMDIQKEQRLSRLRKDLPWMAESLRKKQHDFSTIPLYESMATMKGYQKKFNELAISIEKEPTPENIKKWNTLLKEFNPLVEEYKKLHDDYSAFMAPIQEEARVLKRLMRQEKTLTKELGAEEYRYGKKEISPENRQQLIKSGFAYPSAEDGDFYAFWDRSTKRFVTNAEEYQKLVWAEEGELPDNIVEVNLEDGFTPGSSLARGLTSLAQIPGGLLHAIATLEEMLLKWLTIPLNPGKTFPDVDGATRLAARKWNKTAEKIISSEFGDRLATGAYMEDTRLKDLADPQRFVSLISEQVPLFAGLAALYSFSGGTAATTGMFAAESQEVYLLIDKYEQEVGEKLPIELTMAIQYGVGGLNAYLEKIGIEAILGMGAFKKLISGFTRAIFGVTIEIATEGVQGANTALSEAIYNEFVKAGIEEYWGEFKKNAIAATPMSLTGVGGMTIIRSTKEAAAEKKYKQARAEQGKALEQIAGAETGVKAIEKITKKEPMAPKAPKELKEKQLKVKKEAGIEEEAKKYKTAEEFVKKQNIPKFKGIAYRADSGYSHSPSDTAYDVVKFESEELGNKGEYAHLSKEIIEKLKDIPAKDIVWVTKTKAKASEYGEVDKVYDLGDNPRIIAEDGDGGFLVLKSKGTKQLTDIWEKANKPKQPTPVEVKPTIEITEAKKKLARPGDKQELNRRYDKLLGTKEKTLAVLSTPGMAGMQRQQLSNSLKTVEIELQKTETEAEQKGIALEKLRPRDEIAGMKEVADLFKAVDVEGQQVYEFVDETFDIIERSKDPNDPLTPEQALEILVEHGEEFDPEAKFTITGENYRDAANKDIIRVYRGADIGTIIEERSEAWYKRQIDEDETFESNIKKHRADYEAKTGIKSGENDIEWFSSLAIDYAAGGKTIGAIHKTLKAILDKFKQYAQAILKGGQRLRTEIEKGQVSQELQDALGRSIEEVTKKPTKKAPRGKPGQQIKTETKPFKNWFGDSKVVDDDGKPLVVYHGTNKSFDAFDLSELRESTGAGSAGLGFFFSSANIAQDFAGYDGSNLMPVYLNISNPKVIPAGDFQEMLFGENERNEKMEFLKESIEDDYGYSLYYGEGLLEFVSNETGQNEPIVASKLSEEGHAQYDELLDMMMEDPRDTFDYGYSKKDWEKLKEKLIREGHDGIIVDAEDYTGGRFNLDQAEELYSNNYIAFQPTQIKSATANRGTFDPANPDITYQLAQQSEPIEYTVSDFKKLLVKQYGETIPIYHGGEERDLINDNLKSQYLNRTGLSGLYFTIGKPEYFGRGVMYRFDVPVDYLIENAELDMEDTQYSDTEDYAELFNITEEWAENTDPEARALSSLMYENKGNMDGIPIIFRNWDDEVSGIFSMPNEYFTEKYKDEEDYNNRNANTTFQLAQQSTPEFKNWFKDSKVVDKAGKPIEVYHGTDVAFDEFKTQGEKAKTLGGFMIHEQLKKDAFFFTDDPQIATDFAKGKKQPGAKADVLQRGQIYPVYLSLQKPATLDAKKMGWGYIQNQVEKVMKSGKYDGIIIKDVVDWYDRPGYAVLNPATVYVAFKPTQIKSVYNRGTFSETDPRISRQVKVISKKKLTDIAKKNPDGFTVDRNGVPIATGFTVSVTNGLEWKGQDIDFIHDVVEKNDRLGFGGWFNERLGEPEIDATLVLDNKEEALKMAREYGQEAIFELGVNIQTKLKYTKKELAALKKNVPDFTKPLPLPAPKAVTQQVKKKLTKDEALHKLTADWRGKLSPAVMTADVQESYANRLNALEGYLEHIMETTTIDIPKASKWWSEDIVKMMEGMEKELPGIMEDRTETLQMKLLLAVTSQGMLLDLNHKQTLYLLHERRATGKYPLWKPGGITNIDTHGLWGDQLHKINKLEKHFKGDWEAITGWLVGEEVTIAEMKKQLKAIGLSEDLAKTEDKLKAAHLKAYPAMIFGSKIGSMYGALHNLNLSALDIWMARIEQIATGDILINEKGDTIDVPKHRKVFLEAIRNVGKKLGYAAHELQSTVWVHIKELFHEMGTPRSSSYFTESMEKREKRYDKFTRANADKLAPLSAARKRRTFARWDSLAPDGKKRTHPFKKPDGEEYKKEPLARKKKKTRQLKKVSLEDIKIKKEQRAAVDIIRMQSAKDKAALVPEFIRNRRSYIDLHGLEMRAFVHELNKKTTKKERELIPFIIEGTEVPDALERPDLQELDSEETRERLKDVVRSVEKKFKETWLDIVKANPDMDGKDIERYVTHIWDIPKNKRAEAVTWFSTHNKWLEGRYIDTIYEGISVLGLKPKTLDIGEILNINAGTAHNVIANKKFVSDIRALSQDGYQLVTTRGQAPEGFVEIRHSAMRDPYTGAYLKAHPDLARAIKVIFTEVNSTVLGNTYDVVGAYLKKMQLSISLFHHFALTETGIALMGVIKTGHVLSQLARGRNLVFKNMDIARDAVEHNLQLGASKDIPVAKIQKALRTLSVKTKGVAKPLEWANDKWDKALWDYLHDGLKLYAYEHLVSKLDTKYSELDMRNAKREIAALVNDTFGGQNIDILGASPAIWKVGSRLLLSLDWQVSTMRQALSVTGLGAAYKETRALRRKIGRHFWYRAAIYTTIGINLLNYTFRKKDEEENPELYPDDMNFWDYTMMGNTTGSQTYLFTGRNDDGTEAYLRWGKQFRELPELLYDDTGFNLPWATIKKLGGKAHPLIHLIMMTFTGRTASGYDVFSMKHKEGLDKTISYMKELLKAPLPFSTKNMLREDRKMKTTDWMMPSGKGMTSGKARRLFTIAIKRGDINLWREVYIGAARNNLVPADISKQVIQSIKTDMNREKTGFGKDVQELDKKIRDAKTPSEMRVLTKRKNKILKERQKAKKSLEMLSRAEIMLKRFYEEYDMGKNPLK